MALEDAKTPDVKPLGSPEGRFAESPLANTTMRAYTYNNPADPLAGEGASITGIPGKDPLKRFSPVGRHNQESKTFGTGTPADLSKNDPFGNL